MIVCVYKNNTACDMIIKLSNLNFFDNIFSAFEQRKEDDGPMYICVCVWYCRGDPSQHDASQDIACNGG